MMQNFKFSRENRMFEHVRTCLGEVNWLFVIIKSYVKDNFKERNKNNNNS